MPAANRLDAIRRIMESAPTDPFPRYGYAMELKNAGRFEEAHAAFDELERRFPDYVAQYLMHHGVLIALVRKADAKAVCQRGLEAARRKGDAHAQGELAQAIEALEHGDD